MTDMQIWLLALMVGLVLALREIRSLRRQRAALMVARDDAVAACIRLSAADVLGKTNRPDAVERGS